ncbi:SDR family oxidoreductase [Thioclava sp. GXIMD4216]|uniref:SDR family oxidoreductase n=1 Tax=Thioclava litoralis TaxID=3076557 RepID=A0ABZ1E112_9RHOB|nr:SDR family oxidoreductase [Thioclava sp. FTW29]
MAHIFLIGATGGIGARLLPMLIAAGHEVTALHRTPEQAAKLTAQGASPVLGDMMELTAQDLTPMIEGHDIVIFSAGAAGSGLDRTSRIDGEGPREVMAAMGRAGVDRFYLVSAFPEAGRWKEPNPNFEHYMRVKKEADAAVVRSALSWVILRPGTLVTEDEDGRIAAGLALPYGTVKRGNVARALATLVDMPDIRHELIELTDGESPPLEALQALRRSA